MNEGKSATVHSWGNDPECSWEIPTVVGATARPPPSGREFHSAVFIQCKSGAVGVGDVWIFGGSTGDVILDDLCVYNLKDRKWRRPPRAQDAAWPSPRSGHTANVVKVSALGQATKGFGWNPDSLVMLIIGEAGGEHTFERRPGFAGHRLPRLGSARLDSWAGVCDDRIFGTLVFGLGSRLGIWVGSDYRSATHQEPFVTFQTVCFKPFVTFQT